MDADDYIYPWGLGAMVEMMELFPNAGWGICSLDQFVEMPFPIELNPKTAYELNYSGKGIFNRAPLSSIIRKDVFLQVGGFRNIRMAGDNDMWHRLGQKYNVILMPKGMVWYRQHGEQEMQDFEKFSLVYEEIKYSYLRDAQCPLDKEFSRKVIRDNKQHHFTQIFKDIIRLRTKKIRHHIISLRR